MTEQHCREKVQQALDARLSSVRAGDALSARILHQVKEETKPMKRKVSAAILLALLLTLAATVAVAAAWPGVTYFLTERIFGSRGVNPSGVTAPVSQRADSRWLDIEVTDAYWAERHYADEEGETRWDELNISFHAGVRNENQVLIDQTCIGQDGENFDQIWWNHEILDLEAWRRGREILEITDVSLDGARSSYDYVTSSDGMTYLISLRDVSPERLEKGGEFTLTLTVRSRQSGETENAALRFTLPPMTRQSDYMAE